MSGRAQRPCSLLSPPDRYILGRRTLAAGEDRKAEELFLEALDAEPTTFGACAALLLALNQVRCAIGDGAIGPSLV